jgi:hypothetical protein
MTLASGFAKAIGKDGIATQFRSLFVNQALDRAQWSVLEKKCTKATVKVS